MADELEIDEEDVKPKTSKKMILLIVGLIVILIGAGVTFYMVATAPEEVEGEAEVVEGQDDSVKEKKKEEKLNPEELPAPALYFNMEPEFVINLAQDSEQTYLVVKVSLMTRDESVMGVIEANYPLLRSLIIEILASQRSQDLRSFKGKKELKEVLLAEIQSFMKNEIGVVGVEQILFTHFIME